MEEKKLIVNADDFGQSPGINKGIIQAHEKGIVTSASLMVRYPDAVEAAYYSKHHNVLGVGLHIDLGEWIFKNGKWIPIYEVVALDDLQAVQQEVNKQLEAFYEIMDREPTHIDSHQHVHLRDGIRPVFDGLAGKLNITLRRCGNRVNYNGDFYGQATDGSPFHKAIGTIGLLKIIEGLPAGITEMACHPGLKNDFETMYKLEREIEVMTLCDNTIKEAIKSEQIQLCSFEGITYN